MSLKSRLRAVLSQVRDSLPLPLYVSPPPSSLPPLSLSLSIGFRVAFGVSRLLNKSTGGQRSRVEPDRRRGTPNPASPSRLSTNVDVPPAPSLSLSSAAIIQF